MSSPYILKTGGLPDRHCDSDGQVYMRHIQAIESSEDGKVFGELSAAYPGLMFQIFKFLQDDFRCVFTFDRLEKCKHTDAIIGLLSLDSDSAGKDIHLSAQWELFQLDRVVRALGLDVFAPPGSPQRRFGYMIVPGTNTRREAIKTFVLYKTATLRRLAIATALWAPPGHTRTPTDLLRLVGTWDAARAELETMLVHGLFGELPPDIGHSPCTDKKVLALFASYKNNSGSYNTFKHIWHDFMRL